ncbi:MAG: glycosyltransferase family 4 protein [Candidatus Omnitrophica bacterium]|nr:glycosyltransferase family 4 protein [Candidatus Omnitrophota bacterium]
MIMPEYPFPVLSGEKRRIAAFLHELSRNHQITVVALGDPKFSEFYSNHDDLWIKEIIPHKFKKFTPAVKAFCTSKTYLEVKVTDELFRKTINNLLRTNDFDIIWINFLNLFASIFDEIKIINSYPNKRRPLLLLDQHSLNKSMWESFLTNSKSLVQKFYFSRELRKNIELEKRYLRYFDTIMSVSDEEKRITENYVSAPERVIVVPNGVDVDYFRPAPKITLNTSPKLVFAGRLDALPNEDGILWFLKDIFPRILKEFSNTQFLVAGSNPTRLICRKASDRIRIFSNPSDLRIFYSQADIFVIPLRSGAGTKLKTLEAMAMALPIVSTDIGVEGLNVVADDHLYIANDPGYFADRVMSLLAEPEKAKTMGQRARSLVEKYYTWRDIAKSIEAKIISSNISKENAIRHSLP